MSMKKMNKEYKKFLENVNEECFESKHTYSEIKEYENNLEDAYKNMSEEELKDIYSGLFVVEDLYSEMRACC